MVDHIPHVLLIGRNCAELCALLERTRELRGLKMGWASSTTTANLSPSRLGRAKSLRVKQSGVLLPKGDRGRLREKFTGSTITRCASSTCSPASNCLGTQHSGHARLLSSGQKAPALLRETRTPLHKYDNYGYRISAKPPRERGTPRLPAKILIYRRFKKELSGYSFGDYIATS